MPKTTFLYRDAGNENSGVSLNTPPLTILNIEAYTSGVPGNPYNRMLDAIAGLTSGTLQRTNVVAETVLVNLVAPVDTSAQRERKAYVSYRDNVTGLVHGLEIPIFNMNGFTVGQVGDSIDLTTPEWVAFVTELEGYFTSHLGNSLTVLAAKHVGRAS